MLRENFGNTTICSEKTIGHNYKYEGNTKKCQPILRNTKHANTYAGYINECKQYAGNTNRC